MHWSYAMISSKVTPLIEEGVDVDGTKEVGEVAGLDHLNQNYASLRLTVAASIAPI